MQVSERPGSIRRSPVICTTPVDEPLGDRLKTYFDRVTAGPVPDRLMQLAAELEAAFERGELKPCAKAAAVGKR